MGKPDHEPFESCWCEPRLHYRSAKTNREIWLHRYMDAQAVVVGLHAGLPEGISLTALGSAELLADDCEEATWLELG